MLKSFLQERRRSRAVQALRILDTPTDPIFDRIVDDAANAFRAPIALLSLIRDDRQWVKAARGMAITCLDRDQGVCQSVLDRDGVLEVCDLADDPRYARLGPVRATGARYYIGAPLRLMEGIDVGALCVADTVVRAPASADQRAYLLGLARSASNALEARPDVLRRGAAA